MSSLSGLIIGAVVVLCSMFVFWAIMFYIYYKANISKNPVASYQEFTKNIWSYKLLPSSKFQLIVGIVSVILFVIFVCLLAKGLNDNGSGGSSIDRNPVNVETFGNSGVTYAPIGYGPVIDKTKVKNWINGTSGISGTTLKTGQTAWLDGNGVPMAIPTDQFKSLYGYIPPSFAYYPKGQTKNDYNFKNYQDGRLNCMKACTLTNCVAVQTEVPENCTQRANVTGNGNSCGSNSEFSCTLFYDNIKNADDAYWNIGNVSSGAGLTNSPGCFESTGTSCLGKKYYEDSEVPIDLVNKSIKPSQNPTTFCDSNVTNATNCIKRPLLTTEYVQSNYPYYALPVNASKIKGSISGKGDYSMVVPTKTYKNGSGTSCGVVGGNLVSCGSTKACAQGESSLSSSDCWKIDTASCSGDPYSQSSGATQLQTYKNNYSKADPAGSNYDDLYPSCYYRQQLTVVGPIQFNCDADTVQRGCWGSPPILYTDSLTSSGDVAACSDTSVIPTMQRCQDGTNLAACNGFPFSCGSNNGSNTLWVRQ
jgi:hypothetical protein